MKNPNTKTHGGGESAPDLSSAEAVEAWLKEKGVTVSEAGTDTDFLSDGVLHYWHTTSCPRLRDRERHEDHAVARRRSHVQLQRVQEPREALGADERPDHL